MSAVRGAHAHHARHAPRGEGQPSAQCEEEEKKDAKRGCARSSEHPRATSSQGRDGAALDPPTVCVGFLKRTRGPLWALALEAV